MGWLRPGGLASLELKPIEDGGGRINLMRADARDEPPGKNARVGVTWIGTGRGTAARYPLDSYWHRPSVRPFVYIGVLLSRPQDVHAVIPAAAGSRGVVVTLPRSGGDVQRARLRCGLASLKECGPSPGAALP